MTPNWIKAGASGMKAFMLKQPIVFTSIVFWVIFVTAMLIYFPGPTMFVILLVVLSMTGIVILHWAVNRLSD